MFSKKQFININGKLMDFEDPRIMGILNVTPDSFYDGGHYTTQKSIEKRIKKIIDEGADIIDAGGMSTRPGAEIISSEQEWKRLEPALSLIRDISSDIPVSVDTFRTEIAQKAVNKYNAGIINDISGGSMDSEMFDFVAEKQIPYIMMHMQGTPADMQKNPVYTDFPGDILEFFHKKIAVLREKHLHDIIIDPGFGFGKTLDHNYTLLNYLHRFTIFDCPLLTGISRKSMITKYLEIPSSESLPATSVLHSLAIIKGANILRVHDVSTAKQAITLIKKTKNSINDNW